MNIRIYDTYDQMSRAAADFVIAQLLLKPESHIGLTVGKTPIGMFAALVDSYRSGALGIGATKWYMIRTILLPSAAPGILTGVILSIGRIVGESAALLFTAGSGFQLPKNLFGKLFESSGTLTIQLYLSMQKAKYDQAFGIAVVLLIIVLGINLLTRFLTNRFDVTKLK